MTELEKELNRRADIIIRQEKQIQIDTEQIRALQKQKGELTDKVRELKAQIEKMKWHKVSDGDLPKAYQKCYFIYSNVYGKDGKISFSKSDIKVLTGVYAFFLDEETGEETTEPCFYDDINDDEIGLKEVYAWKEIVLPELKEIKEK